MAQQFVLQINGASPVAFIESVERNSEGVAIAYTETPYITSALSGNETVITSLGVEIINLVGTTPIRK